MANIFLHFTISNQAKKSYVFRVQGVVDQTLYNIGEHVYYLSDEFKESHKDIPWGMISGLRHRLVHDYEGTNWSIICDVVFDELPVLIEQLEKLI